MSSCERLLKLVALPAGYFCEVEISATIIPATLADVSALTELINQAYRGPATLQSWTTETHLLDGPRISEDAVRKMSFATGKEAGVLLKYVASSGILIGCVYLQPRGRHLYLSTLAVAPEAQAQGIGQQLLAAAVAYARQHGCLRIRISVLSARPELLAWYERHGYQRTGHSEAFPATTEFGRPRQPLVLLTLEKVLGN